MKRRDHPLVVEYHDGFKDVYVWDKLPGGFRDFEFYGFIILTLIVFILQFIDGMRSIEAYIGSFFILLVLAGVYKGFQVGMESIGFKPYNPKYFTRLAPEFYIWANDPARTIDPDMKIRVRPVSPQTDYEGVVYLYLDNSREIIFVANDNQVLEEFATLLEMYYQLERTDDIL